MHKGANRVFNPDGWLLADFAYSRGHRGYIGRRTAQARRWIKRSVRRQSRRVDVNEACGAEPFDVLPAELETGKPATDLADHWVALVVNQELDTGRGDLVDMFEVALHVAESSPEVWTHGDRRDDEPVLTPWGEMADPQEWSAHAMMAASRFDWNL